MLTSLYQGQAQQEPGVQPMKFVADERSNSVLISGEPAARLRAKALIANLDTPQQGGGETQVRYLRYADAEKLAAETQGAAVGRGRGRRPGPVARRRRDAAWPRRARTHQCGPTRTTTRW